MAPKFSKPWEQGKTFKKSEWQHLLKKVNKAKGSDEPLENPWLDYALKTCQACHTDCHNWDRDSKDTCCFPLAWTNRKDDDLVLVGTECYRCTRVRLMWYDLTLQQLSDLRKEDEADAHFYK